MSEESMARTRPRGLLRAMLKLPVLLYRAGLAQQMADRGIMLLYTTGRRSGIKRVSGLSFFVDGTTVYASAGWGKRTDWYQNLLANPNVEVQIGSVRRAVRARPVTDPQEVARATAVMGSLREGRGGPPRPLWPLLRRLGLDFEAEIVQFLAHPGLTPMVALELAESLPERPPWRGPDRRVVVPVAIGATALLGFLLVVFFRSRRKR